MRISDWSSDVCSSDLFVAGQMTEAVVDAGETVEIRHKYRGFQHRLPVRLRPVEPFGKGDSIGKAGQGVAQHLVAQAMLGFHFGGAVAQRDLDAAPVGHANRSEEHTSELQSLMRISYA